MANNTDAVYLTQTGGRPATKGIIPGRYALSVGFPNKPAPTGWKWTALSDVARLESGHTPSRRFPEYWNGAIPWIGIKDATDNHGRVVFDTYQHVTQEGIDNSSARILPADTVCLSRTASVGFVVVMGRPMATSQDFVNWICSDKIDNHFLKYILLSEHDSMLRFASGTTHQTIYYPEAKAFHVCLPDIQEQREIAGLLCALDDKIELNRRMNRTLEAMARAVFRQWFVESDEVQNWDAGRVIDDFNLTMGQSPPGETYNEKGEGMPFFQGRTDFGFRFPTNRVFCTAPTRFAEEGDTLVSVRAPVGDINMATEKSAIGRGVAAIRHKTGSRSYTYYAMHLLQEDFFRFEGEGTVFGSINRSDFENLKIAIPPVAKVKEFETVCFPVDQMIENNEKESRTLASLRDTFLPKLMRGEVRVKGVEDYQ